LLNGNCCRRRGTRSSTWVGSSFCEWGSFLLGNSRAPSTNPKTFVGPQIPGRNLLGLGGCGAEPGPTRPCMAHRSPAPRRGSATSFPKLFKNLLRLRHWPSNRCVHCAGRKHGIPNTVRRDRHTPSSDSDGDRHFRSVEYTKQASRHAQTIPNSTPTPFPAKMRPTDIISSRDRNAYSPENTGRKGATDSQKNDADQDQDLPSPATRHPAESKRRGQK
jgi:hypothetical protein